MTHQRQALLAIGIAVVLSACAAGASPGSGEASGGPAGASQAVGVCEPAPDWLIVVLQDALVVREATLSNVYVLRADGFSSGPAQLQTTEFESAWWVAGKISGAGVRPEIATWLTNRTSRDQAGQILSVDAAAQRYSTWESDQGQPIIGPGISDVRACVGPIPEA